MLARVAILLFVVFLPVLALAEMIVTPCPDEEVLRLRGLNLRGENDSFAKTDRNYSQGLTIIAESHDL